MSIVNALAKVGEPVSYYPRLAVYLGGVKLAAFVSVLQQLQSQRGGEYGVRMTREEWKDATGLSYAEQTTVRRLLREVGYLEERRTRENSETCIYYLLDYDSLDADFTDWLESSAAISSTQAA